MFGSSLLLTSSSVLVHTTAESSAATLSGLLSKRFRTIESKFYLLSKYSHGEFDIYPCYNNSTFILCNNYIVSSLEAVEILHFSLNFWSKMTIYGGHYSAGDWFVFKDGYSRRCHDCTFETSLSPVLGRIISSK
jgi:hypothetical protein